jgi:two-component system cell cycle sensor histidine kinase/response regulator CckA
LSENGISLLGGAIQSWGKLHSAFRPFRDLPLRVKGLAVVAIPVVWLLAVAAAFYFVERSDQSAQDWVSHTLEVRSEIQAVHSRFEEAETGVAGYYVTRDPEWLGSVQTAQRTLPVLLDRLQRGVADNPSQLARISRLKTLIEARLASIERLPAPAAAANVHAVLVQSKGTLDAVRRLLAGAMDEENRLLTQRQAAARVVSDRSYDVIAAGVLLAPFGAILAMVLFTSGVTRRVQILEENSTRVARGRPIVPMRSGNDEIGRLEQSLGEAASLLAQRDAEIRHANEGLETRVAERTVALERAQEDLAEANRQVQAVIDASPLAIVRLDLEGRVQAWNHAAEQIYGWTAEEVLNRPLPTVPDEGVLQFHKLLAEAGQGEVLTGFPLRRRRKDGTLIDVRLWSAPLRDSAGVIRGKIAILADVTDQRRLEQQLMQSQKMEAIGRLAGGVAHDFNNVITVVSGYGQMLLDGLQNEPDLRDAAEEVLKAADRAAGLAAQLLTFSRRQASQPRIIEINAVVRDMERMLGRLIGESVELATVLRPGVGPLRADPGQIEQVVMNLVVNARDAMPGGGKITVETAEVVLDEHYSATHAGVTPGKYVMLAVSDTGTGMDAETRSHIFEPFFTTKERGKGTGLGLSTVYGIVKQHGGDIWVYSEPGRGTTFKIYLPLAAAPATSPAAEPKPPVRGSCGETILLVEDEEGVRKYVRGVLETHGYRVLEASSGEAALKIGTSFQEPIALLLTDVVMPKMGGRELAAALAPHRPGMKVLYLSGYTDHVVVDRGVVHNGSEFLQKPFTPDALARKIREILDDDRSRAA